MKFFYLIACCAHSELKLGKFQTVMMIVKSDVSPLFFFKRTLKDLFHHFFDNDYWYLINNIQNKFYTNNRYLKMVSVSPFEFVGLSSSATNIKSIYHFKEFSIKKIN